MQLIKASYKIIEQNNQNEQKELNNNNNQTITNLRNELQGDDDVTTE